MSNDALPLEEKATFAELASICCRRAQTYGLLARLYRAEIDAALLSELKSTRFPAATGNASMDAGYRAIATYLSNTWENSLEECAVDYARTFLGNGVDAHAAAYPYESIHTSEKRLLMQSARDEILAIYRSVGLRKSESWKEGEDHVALELELMQILCQRTAVALSDGNEDAAANLIETQRNFLEDHLGAWAPMLAAEMRRFVQTDLYAGLSLLTEGFLEVEREFLGEILDSEEEA